MGEERVTSSGTENGTVRLRRNRMGRDERKGSKNAGVGGEKEGRQSKIWGGGVG